MAIKYCGMLLSPPYAQNPTSRKPTTHATVQTSRIAQGSRLAHNTGSPARLRLLPSQRAVQERKHHRVPEIGGVGCCRLRAAVADGVAGGGMLCCTVRGMDGPPGGGGEELHSAVLGEWAHKGKVRDMVGFLEAGSRSSVRHGCAGGQGRACRGRVYLNLYGSSNNRPDQITCLICTVPLFSCILYLGRK
jgi:hypothetical protein